MEDENQGSMFIGLLLGFFLGCLGILIAAFAVKGSKTLTGSIVGMVAQVLLWVCMGGAVAVLQVVLMNA